MVSKMSVPYHTFPLDLNSASEAGWQMLGEEAVVAEEAPVFVVVF